MLGAWLAAVAILIQLGLPAHWVAGAAALGGETFLCHAGVATAVTGGPADQAPAPDAAGPHCPLCAVAAAAAPPPEAATGAPSGAFGKSGPVVAVHDAPVPAARHRTDAHPRAPPIPA